MNTEGKTVIRPRFDFAQDFHEGVAGVCLPPASEAPSRRGNRNRCGFIDRRGAFVVPPVFYDVGSFFEGLAWYSATDGGPYGYVDHSGARAIRARFRLAGDFHEGVAAVAVGEWSSMRCSCYGFIDRRGAFVIAPAFDKARAFSEGRAAVAIAGRWGFVDMKGSVAVTPTYEEVGDYSEGLAWFRQDGRYGYLDREGRVQIPARYGPRPGRFSHGVAHVSGDDGVVVFIDRTGQPVVTTTASAASDFSEGLADIYHFTVHGFIDRDGKPVVEPAFLYAADFREGLAAVYIDQKWGYVRRDGHFAIVPTFADPPVYDASKGFREGLAVFAVKPGVPRR